MPFSFSIVTDVCEGCGECIPFCPGECIHWADEQRNAKGTHYVFVDAGKCINCYACQSGCPVMGAILDRWRPECQRAPSIGRTYSGLREEWRTEAVLQAANRLRGDGSPDVLATLAEVLAIAGCDDPKLLAFCRERQTKASVQWLADLVCDAESTRIGGKAS